MIDCNEALRALDDHVDGTLGRERAAAVAGHLAGCIACRRAEEETRRLVAAAAQLPVAAAPERDLWPEIAARVRSEPNPAAAAAAATWRRWAGLAAAAALLVTLTAAVTARWTATGRATGAATPIVPAAMPDGGESSGVAEAFADYERAARSLRAALARRAAARSSAEARVLDENLAIVDAAVARLKDALASDPGNRDLTLLLASAYREQIGLLQTANDLTRI